MTRKVLLMVCFTFAQLYCIPLGAQTQPESQIRSMDTINIVVRRNGKFLARADKNFLMWTPLSAIKSTVDSSLYTFLIKEKQKLGFYDPDNDSRTIFYNLYLADTTVYRELTPRDMKRIKPSSISKLVKGIFEHSREYLVILSDYYPNVRLILQQRNGKRYREYKIIKWDVGELPIVL